MAIDLSALFGQQPDYSQFISPAETQRMQSGAGQQALLNAAIALLGSSGQTRQPISTGQALGGALGAASEGYNQSFDRNLKQMLTGMQLGEFSRKQKQAKEIEQIRKGAFTPTVTVAPGMSSQDPMVAKMMEENLLMGDVGLQSLARSGNFPVQGKPQEITTPQVSQEFDIKKLISGLMGAGYIDEAKKYAPEYLTAGDSVYQKNITGGLTPVINNQGKLTGDFGNYAKLFYGSDKVSDLPKGASQNIVQYINKGQALTGGVAMPVGKEGANLVDKDLLELGRSRLNFQSAMNQFRPEFLTRPFQAKMTLLSEAEKLNRPLSETEKSDLTAYTAFQQNAMSNLNLYINQLTGAAIGAGSEENRLRSAIPDPQKDSPTQFTAKTNEVLRLGKLAEVRLSYVKKNGLKITDVSLDNIPSIMKAREAEIARDLKLDPNKPDDRDAIRTKLAQEFGLL